MALIEIDESWEDYEQEEKKRAAERRVIKRDRVKARLVKWDLTTSKKGTRQLVWISKIVEDQEYADREVRFWTPIEGKGKYIFKNLAAACGVALSGKGVDPSPMEGAVIYLELETKPDEEGIENTRVKGFSAI